MNQALDKRGDVKIDVCAILNDTTGCLMSCAWKDNRCRIGLILGTGTNACYLEDVKNIETLNKGDFNEQEHMVVNTEWGAFGDNGELDFIKTKWDENVSFLHTCRNETKWPSVLDLNSLQTGGPDVSESRKTNL